MVAFVLRFIAFFATVLRTRGFERERDRERDLPRRGVCGNFCFFESINSEWICIICFGVILIEVMVEPRFRRTLDYAAHYYLTPLAEAKLIGLLYAYRDGIVSG